MSNRGESGAFNLQHQIRNNANDLQDYLRDLDNWAQESKKKDQSLAANKSILKPNLPPIRSSKPAVSSHSKAVNQAKPKKSKHTKPPKDVAPKKRISAYDYGAWDRLDVDNAMKEMDSSSECESESSSGGDEKGSREDEDQDARREERAETERQKGNEFFKSGKYTDAIEHYSRALQLAPDSESILTNRAIALIRTDRHASAEEDCSKAIAINPKNVKALYRRGIARFNLVKLQEALSDFDLVLDIEPGNKSAQEFAVKVKIKLQPELEGRFKAVTKPKHLLSKKPLMDVKIQDFGSGSGSETESDSEQKIAKSSEDIMSEIFEPPKEDIENIGKVESPPKLKKLQPEIPKKLSPTKHSIPVEPTDSSQVMNAWKTLKNEQDMFYDYFHKIPTSLYPKLLVQFLENDGLSHIIKIFVDKYLPNEVSYSEELLALTKVPRFNVAVMFLAKDDLNRCQLLFQHLISSSDSKEANLAALAKLYNVRLIFSSETKHDS